MKHLKSLISIPLDVRPEFYADAVRRNSADMRFICALLLIIAAAGTASILFAFGGVPDAGGRLRFYMYCALMVIIAAYLLAERLMRRDADVRRWAMQLAAAVLIFVWHILMNAFSLRNEPSSDITVYIAAALCFGVFLEMPAACALACLGGGCALLLLLTPGSLDMAGGLSACAACAAVCAVAVLHNRGAGTRLTQNKAIMTMNVQMQDLLQRDALTGLLNRAAFTRRAEEIVSRNPSGAVTMLIMDLDNFSEINNEYGCSCGDCVLRQAAQGLQQVFMNVRCAGRLGDDEFAVIIDEPLSAAEAAVAGRRLEMKLSKVRWNGGSLSVGCTLGVCVALSGGQDYEQLYAQASLALAAARENGDRQALVTA